MLLNILMKRGGKDGEKKIKKLDFSNTIQGSQNKVIAKFCRRIFQHTVFRSDEQDLVVVVAAFFFCKRVHNSESSR